MVYALHIMRTNVEIDQELVTRVMRRYGLRTKRAAIELALQRPGHRPDDARGSPRHARHRPER